VFPSPFDPVDRQARSVAEEGRRVIADLGDTVRDLERRVEDQAAVIQALSALLADRLGVSEGAARPHGRRSNRETLAVLPGLRAAVAPSQIALPLLRRRARSDLHRRGDLSERLQ
jgi:hypothetical protein